MNMIFKCFSLVFLMMISSCNNSQTKSATENKFLSFFKSMPKEKISDLKFKGFKYNEQIEDMYVEKYLCRNANLCFYSNKYLRNKYYPMYKVEYEKNKFILFYRKLEPPVDSKIYALTYDLVNDKVLSEILIAGVSPLNYNAKVDITSSIEFKITRDFINENYSEPSEHSRTSKQLIESYFIDSNGVFKLKE